MILADLLAGTAAENQLSEDLQSLNITGLSSDSRYAKKGDLFFAKKGEKVHGLDYLDTLIEKEIAVILYEDSEESYRIPEHIPSLKITDIDTLIHHCVKVFYAEMLERVSLIGVTGTEGKTSVTQFIVKAFDALNIDCGLIGTNGIGFLGNLKENTHTTPDLLALYQSIAEIDANEDVRVLMTGKLPIAIEVTSHALDQKRVAGLSFETTVFNNLNRDHLDYHGTLEAYGEAKARLFLEYDQNNAIFNVEDPFGKKLFSEVQQAFPKINMFPFGESAFADNNYLQIHNLELHEKGLKFVLRYKNNEYPIESSLFGAFNAYNLVAAIAVLISFDLPIERILSVIPIITNVKGRMEMMHLKNDAVAVVDYAHKPNALKQALISLRGHLHNGRLISIFGCGGNRDTGKRALMAQIAEEFADEVIVTSDNPRLEDPNAIVEEIKAGFKNPEAENIFIEVDRAKAIEQAIKRSKKGDIILIAGKGHEDYQILGNKKIYFSDFAEVQKNNEEL